VIDYGDAVCPPGMSEVAEHAIWQRVTEVASRGIFPVVLGGEHSITYPAAKAVADVVGHGKLGVIHFDAHADTVPEMFGNMWSHGTPMRRLIESGAVPGKNFVQIGLRGYWPPRDILDWMKLQGMQWHLMSKVRTVGTAAVIEEAIEQALNGPEMIYISLDIDVLDPGFAPGCTNPEPGGMTPATCCGPCSGSSRPPT
jgi:arginase family enzyme